MKAEVFQSKKDLQWYWRLRASNGKVIAQSEGYTRRPNCLKTLKGLLDIPLVKLRNTRIIYIT